MASQEETQLINAALRATGPKAPRTLQLYKECLHRLLRMGIDLEEPEAVMIWLGQYKQTTQNTYLSAIIGYHKGVEGEKHPLVKQYQKLLVEGIEGVRAQYDRSAFTEAQLEHTANVDWDAIRTYRDQLERQIKSFTPDSMDRRVVQSHLLLSLYTKQPPTRNDWVDVILLDEPRRLYDKEANYYVKPEGTLILSKYKTARTYGQKRIRVPDEIQADIERAVELLRPTKYLFEHQTGIQWSRNYLSQYFRRLMPGCTLGTCLLRKLVKTEWSKAGMGGADKLAQAMDHGTGTASHYYDQNQRASIENNPLGIAM
jgi:hypothetical protein